MIRSVVRFLRCVRNFLKVVELRGRGIGVGFSSNIDPSVRIYRSGGVVVIGEGTTLCEGVILRAFGGSIKIGAGCSLNPYCVVDGAGGLTIGDNVRIASHTVIVPSNHVFDDPSRPISVQGLTKLGIVIEDDVWIGSGVSILDGVTIGKGAVIGAGAVVTSAVESYSVSVGVPARKVSMRGSADRSGENPRHN